MPMNWTVPAKPEGGGSLPAAHQLRHGDVESARRHVSLALQGGGAHGAFTWGVLDRLLEDERIIIEAISGTSAGAMNAAALAAGYAASGREGARQALDRFWISTSERAIFSPFQRPLSDRLLGRWNLDRSPGYLWFSLIGRLFSPYQTNPLNHHPLRDILASQIDIEAVRACRALRLFITATNVQTGRPRVFDQDDLSLDALLASACLPHLYQAVEIDGDPYWDGGYMGNPAIWPLIYGCVTADVVLVQVNPLMREGIPRTAIEIDNRMNEIAFNASLMHEMRAIAFVQRLLEQDALKEHFAARYKNMRIHVIGDEEGMKALGVTSKFNAERGFFEHLKAAGRACAARWLKTTIGDLGVRSSVDVRATFL
jgi:NTE family protein